MNQAGGTIRGPDTGVAGTSIEVEVTANASSIQVDLGGGADPLTIPVPPGGKVTVPIPPGTQGAVAIFFGKGLGRRGIIVEIVSTGP